jgi:flagellar assembly protein FliH
MRPRLKGLEISMSTNKEQRLGQEIQGLELFTYPEMPWTEEFVGSGNCLVEVFPRICKTCVSEQDAKPLDTNGDESQADKEQIAMLLAEERRKAEEFGHAQGMERGVALGRDEATGHLESERRSLRVQAADWAEKFAVSQSYYFHQAEQETVRLALAIAARILRREAQMDPLLLTGAVRVALGQLSDSTTVRLRVPVEDKILWEEAIAVIPRLASRPQVIGDERLELGDCRIETELGLADLGLWSQLKEIERGFFDRAGNVKTASRDRSPGESVGASNEATRHASATFPEDSSSRGMTGAGA